MASLDISSTVESEQPHDHQDICSNDHEPRAQLIRSRPLCRKPCRDAHTEPRRRLMGAILFEAINRFQRDVFQSSLWGRCEFVEAEFRLLKADGEAPFSFTNVSDFLSVGAGHIRQRLRNCGGTTFKQRIRPKPPPRTWVDFFGNSHQSTRDLESMDSPGKLRTRS